MKVGKRKVGLGGSERRKGGGGRGGSREVQQYVKVGFTLRNGKFLVLFFKYFLFLE
jgi:hypothetical protein